MATSLSRMMKKVSSTLLPLANRRTPHISAIFSTPLKTSTTSTRSIGTSSSANLSSHLSRASTVSDHRPTSVPANKESNSDATLLRNIQSEIDRAEEEFKSVPEAPREFPFKIEDNAEDPQNIILTREYQDEQIKVNILCNNYARYLILAASVEKKSGSTLEFDVEADETSGITIESWAIKNPNAPYDQGPYFSNLDGDLQDDFYTYLEDRGIKPSFITFLCDYMYNKQEKHYNEEEKERILWLKKLKNFIEN